MNKNKKQTNNCLLFIINFKYFKKLLKILTKMLKIAIK